MNDHSEYKEKLSALLDGELSDTERGEVLAHLEACEECQRYFAELNAMHDAFGDMEPIDVPEGFATGVMARLHEDAKPQAVKKPVSRRKWGTLAACAAAVILAVAAVPNMVRMGGAPKSAGFDSAAPAAPEAPMNAAASSATGDPGKANGFTVDESALETELYQTEAAEEAAEALPDSADGAFDTYNARSGDAAPASPEAASAENKAVEHGTDEAEYLDLALSGEGAADYLLSNGAEAGELDGYYFVDASVLQSLPEGLTLGGAHADRVAELGGVKVHVRVAETEAAP